MAGEFRLEDVFVEARVSAGLAPEELASRMGTTKAVITRLENGWLCFPQAAHFGVSQRLPEPVCASVSSVNRMALMTGNPTLDPETATAELGRLWDEGLASGAPADGAAVFHRIGCRLAATVPGWPEAPAPVQEAR